MKVDVLLGLQWGDEGKGKVVDVLTPYYDLVARFQGGPNAGHTLEFEGEKYVLRSIPSGIFQGDKINVIGNGVVLDPALFKAEVEALEKSGHTLTDRLKISKKTHLILPTHRLVDQAFEEAKGAGKIGTTGKGIGPTYTDKIGRRGVRVGDIFHDFKAKYQAAVDRHRAILDQYNFEYDLSALEKDWFEGIECLRRFELIDSEHLINKTIQSDKKILAEGAQGTMLDIDFGSYPFVTSSNTICAGACTGLGVAPRYIGEVYGIFKAYCTRVGGGPFPTELHDEIGDLMRSYTGLFTEPAYISEDIIASRLSWEKDKVYKELVGLAKDRIVRYIPRKQVPFITYVHEREAPERLNLGKETYDSRKERFVSRAKSILDYAKEQNVCRNQLLLSYFGEKNTKPCGQCDVCLKKQEQQVTDADFDKIRMAVLKALTDTALTPEELVQKLAPFKKQKVLQVIRFLLDNGVLKQNKNMKLLVVA
jgi:hypothetical protein